MNSRGDDQPDRGERQIFRLTFDVLATPPQVDRIVERIGEALCGSSLHHPGPCTIAWTATTAAGESLINEHFTAADLHDLHEELGSIEVHPDAQVNAALGL